MLVDTHAHLYNAKFSNDLEVVIGRANEAGVERILLPAVDVATTLEAIALAERYPGVYAMAGVHPTSAHEMRDGDLDRVGEMLSNQHVVAVGETGLDYYWSRDHVELQQETLRLQARLAVQHDLPLVLHNRDVKGSDACSHDLVRILEEVRAEAVGGAALRGVFHCFGGPRWLTDDVMNLGFYVGLGGTLTYKDGVALAAIEDVPIDRIILETDAPYLAPVPHRGSRNEPAYVRAVADRLAEARDLSVEDIAAITTNNAEQLFRLPSWPAS